MKDILLLHGAIGDSSQLLPLQQLLSADHRVHVINFNGHGGKPLSGKIFSIEHFAEEVLDFLTERTISSINIFGYSMGGFVALYLAKHYPDKVKAVITLATKFTWDESIAAKESAMLNANKIEEKIPAFAKTLQARHYPLNWKLLLQKTAAMLLILGKNNPLALHEFTTIQQPVQLMLGDRDKMVSLDETVAVFNQLPNAQLSVMPVTGHPIELVNTERLAFEIRSFF